VIMLTEFIRFSFDFLITKMSVQAFDEEYLLLLYQSIQSLLASTSHEEEVKNNRFKEISGDNYLRQFGFLLPFRVKQDHIGAVAFHKTIDYLAQRIDELRVTHPHVSRQLTQLLLMHPQSGKWTDESFRQCVQEVFSAVQTRSASQCNNEAMSSESARLYPSNGKSILVNLLDTSYFYLNSYSSSSVDR
jgi:hypothetical protein